MKNKNREEQLLKHWQEANEHPYPEDYFVSGSSNPFLIKESKRDPCTIQDFEFVPRSLFGTVSWLAWRLKVDRMKLLILLGGIYRKRVFYCQHHRYKKNGKKRVLFEPKPFLKHVQRQIVRLINDQEIYKYAYGFSGGGIVDALKPHLESKSWAMFDVKNAFPSIPAKIVEQTLRWGINSLEDRALSPRPIMANFSSPATRIICLLCTFYGFLPQGSPSSPRLFDIAFQLIDKHICEVIEKTDLVYTRYADNLFFSYPDKKFPKNIIWKILKEIKGKKDDDFRIKCHKIKFYDYTKEAIRSLGLNMIDGKLKNTRRFRFRLRLHLYRLAWLTEHNEDRDHEKEVLSGMMGFAIKETLPPKLIAEAEKLLREP